MPDIKKEIQYYYDKANSFFELGRHQEALNCNDKAISLDDKFYKSYYFKGNSLKNIGKNKYNEAIVCFDKAIKLNNKDFDSYYNKALILFELKKYEEAIDVINLSLEIDDENSNAYYYKGLCLYNLKKYKEAIEEFGNTVKIDSQYSKAYYYKGLSLYYLKRYEETIEEFDKYLKIADQCDNSYYYKGLSLFELKKYEEALESLKSTNNFNKYDMYYFMGEIYDIKNNYKEAIKYYDKALKNYKEKNNARDYYIIGMTLYKLSLFDNAIDNFNKALSFIFEDKYSNTEDILNYCNNILKLENNNKVFYAYKMMALILLNRYDEALSLYNNVEKNNEVLYDVEIYKKALNILKEKNKINDEHIVKGYDKAISLNPKNEKSYKEKIEYLKSINKNDLVVECYNELIKLNPNNIDIYKEKIEFLKSIGENDIKS